MIKAVAKHLIGGGQDAERILEECIEKGEITVEQRSDGISLYHFPTHELGQKKGSTRSQEGYDRKSLSDAEMLKFKQVVKAVNWDVQALTKKGGEKLALEDLCLWCAELHSVSATYANSATCARYGQLTYVQSVSFANI